MLTFSLTVDRPQSPSAPVQKQDHFDIVAWGNAAENASSLVHNGSMVVVEGRINNRSYETDTGQRKYVTEIDARNVKSIAATTTASDSPFSESSIPDVMPSADSPELAQKNVESVDSSNFSFNETSPSGPLEASVPDSFDTEGTSEDVPF